MDSFSRDQLGAALIAVLVIGFVVGARWLLKSRALPPQKTFCCARCAAIEEHSHRTIAVWRAGKAKVFCDACHARSLEKQRGSRTSSGCMGTLVAVALPALVFGAFYYAYRIA